jgi:hypothetical protein
MKKKTTEHICPDCGRPMKCLSCSTANAGRVGGCAKGPSKARSPEHYQKALKIRWDAYRARKAQEAELAAAEAYKEATQPA